MTKPLDTATFTDDSFPEVTLAHPTHEQCLASTEKEVRDACDSFLACDAEQDEFSKQLHCVQTSCQVFVDSKKDSLKTQEQAYSWVVSHAPGLIIGGWLMGRAYENGFTSLGDSLKNFGVSVTGVIGKIILPSKDQQEALKTAEASCSQQLTALIASN